MPDEAREVVFPEDVPVRLLRGDAARHAQRATCDESEATRFEQRRRLPEDAEIATGAEARLGSDAVSVERLADAARTPDGGQDPLSKR